MSELNVVYPEEIELFVHSLKKSKINEIGSKAWIENHELLVKLDQQAIIEASQNREEVIKEVLILNDKVNQKIYNFFRF